MSESRLQRYAPLTGIVFVALVVVAVIIGGETPSNGDSLQKIASFWKDNRSDQIASAIIGAWSLVFFVWFAAALRSVLRRAEGGPARLSAVNFGGAIIAAGGLLAALSIEFALADGAKHLDPLALRTLTVLSNGFFFPIAVGMGLFFMSAGLLSVRTAVLPVWLGWITVILGIACITPVGFFALLLGAVWIIAISVVLYMRDSQERPAAAAPAQPATPVTPGA